MKKRQNDSTEAKKEKIRLGKAIKKLREKRGYSSRKLAEAVELPPSSMKYIEDGVNAPSPEKYKALISILSPNGNELKHLDSCYSLIRGTPPPDICDFICANPELNNILRLVDNQKLNKIQLSQIKQLFSSIKSDIEKGEK